MTIFEGRVFRAYCSIKRVELMSCRRETREKVHKKSLHTEWHTHTFKFNLSEASGKDA